jgi:hypothetical protein
MPNWGAIAGGLAGAGRGYEASQGRNIPGPQQGGQNGLLMKYLNRRKGMPQGAPAGLPDGSMPAPMPQQGAGPAPVIPQNPNAAMPGPSIAPPSMGKPSRRRRISTMIRSGCRRSRTASRKGRSWISRPRRCSARMDRKR